MNTQAEYKITRYYGNGSFASPYAHIKKSEINYIDGKRNGFSKSWYPNGQLMKQLEYQDDELVGVVRTWNEDGSRDLEYTASYKNEKRNSIKINWEDKTTTLSCEMCGEVMTKNDHAYSDICPDCLEG